MTLYYLLARNALRAAATGENVPALAATLRSDFTFDVAFVDLAGVVAPLEAPEGGSVSTKAVVKLTPESAAVLLDAALESNAEDGTARRYTAVWTAAECDSDAFRAVVNGKSSIQATLEIEVTHAGGTARATCPMTLINANFQPNDTAPDPRADASWLWLKQRAPEANGFTHDDEVKTLTVAGSGTPGADGDSAYEVAVANGFVGDEDAWLASLVGAPGEDGDSAYEVAVANGFVGDEDAWLASLVGAPGEDGGGGSSRLVGETIMPWFGLTPPAGWLFLNALTIGDASSNATARANADTEALFLHLWPAMKAAYENSADSYCFIQASDGSYPGYGASAAADFADHKRLQLPDQRGRVPVGTDDMGGGAASKIPTDTGGWLGGAVDKPGSQGGRKLIPVPLLAHTHTGPSHIHDGIPTAGVGGIINNLSFTAGEDGAAGAQDVAVTLTGSGNTGSSGTGETGSTGSSDTEFIAHSPGTLCNAIICYAP